jgi:hypothetical protein
MQRIGLCTTCQLVEESGADGTTRHNILAQRRTSKSSLTPPVVGQVRIRDQKPLIMRHLEPALIDMTVQEWLAVLDQCVFLWAIRSD